MTVANPRRHTVFESTVTPEVKLNLTTTTVATFYGSFTMADLRAFISACKDVPGSAKVNVTHYAGDQRDGSSTIIKVTG